MKRILFIALVVLGSVSWSAGQSPDVDLVLTVSDGAGGSKDLHFGLAQMATDNIDAALGEVQQPPPPPTGVFDARFVGTDIGINLGEGVLKDYRQGDGTTVGQRLHELRYQVGSGTTITITWNLPTGITAQLQDIGGGNVVTVPMSGSGSYTVTNPGFISKLHMAVHYNLATSTTGDLGISINDAEGWGKPGATATVQLYNSSNMLIAQQNSDAASMVVFTGVPAGSGYSYKVFSNRANSPFTLHYWGKKDGITVSPGGSTQDSFTRNMPVGTRVNVYDNTTNQSVEGTTVPVGTLLRVELEVKNVNEVGSTAQTAKGMIILDRSKTEPFDTLKVDTYMNYALGQVRMVIFYYTPTVAGDYYHVGAVVTNIGGSDVVTDAGDWHGIPFFTVGGATEGRLSVTLYNVAGWGSPGTAGRIELKNGLGQLISSKQTDASSQALFENVTPGTDYQCIGYCQPYTGAAPFAEQRWAVSTSTKVAAGTLTAISLPRNLPYGIAINVYDNLTNQDVSGQSVPAGTNLFAGTDGGVFLSMNGGASWVSRNTGLTDSVVRAVAVSGTTLFAGTAGGVFRSTNSGSSWFAANVGLPATTVYAFAAIGSSVYAATGKGVYLFINNTGSWIPVNNGITTHDVEAIVVSGTSLLAGSYGGGVFLSTDGGLNWSPANTGLTGTVVRALTVVGSNIFAGSNDGVFMSTDNGTSWIRVNSGLTNNFVRSFTAVGNSIFAGTEAAGVFLTTNNGASWTPVNTGLTNLSAIAVAASGNKIFAGTYGGGLFVSTTLGASWTPANTGLLNSFVQVIAVSGSELRLEMTVTNPAAVGGTSSQASVRFLLDRDKNSSLDLDIQSTFTTLAYGETKNLSVIVTPTLPGTYYYAGAVITNMSDGSILSDAGNWSTSPLFTVYETTDKLAPPPPSALVCSPSGWSNVNLFEVQWTDPVDPSGIAAAWYKIGTAPISDADGMRLSSRPLKIACPAEGTALVYVWLEDGAGNKDHRNHATTSLHFDVTRPTGDLSINGGAPSTGSLLVTLTLAGADVGGSGLAFMRFSNDAVQWSNWEMYQDTRTNWDLSQFGGSGVPGLKNVFMELRDGAGNSSLIGQDNIVYTATAIEQTDEAVPNSFTLHPNYPNPFNPSTTVSFAVATPGRVCIQVFALTGSHVGTIVDEQLAPGTYRVDWHPFSLSSGLYLLRMQAHNFNATQQLMLVK